METTSNIQDLPIELRERITDEALTINIRKMGDRVKTIQRLNRDITELSRDLATQRFNIRMVPPGPEYEEALDRIEDTEDDIARARMGIMRTERRLDREVNLYSRIRELLLS